MATRRVCVIGIGNPGRSYTSTRHNVGYSVVERLADRRGWRFRKKVPTAQSAGGRFAGAKVLLVKPLTYVNLTGKIVSHLRTEMEDPALDLMVVLDDLNLALGRIRVRSRGRSGGHRGLESLIQAVGSSVFPRLRVGIGRPDAAEARNFVLSRFRTDEREQADAAVDRAADAVDCWIENGIDMAMNIYNQSEREQA